MNWKTILGAGGFTGALTGVEIALVFSVVGVDPGSFAGLFAIFFGMASLSAVIVNQILKTSGRCCVSLKILVPIGFLTSIIPLLGATFGAPNSEPSTLAMIVLLGAIGGVFWSLPFVGWNNFKGRGSSPEDEG